MIFGKNEFIFILKNNYYFCNVINIKKMKTTIKNDMITAMKNKDAVTRDTLRVLIGELDRNFIKDDVDVVKTVNKMVQNIKETTNDQDEINVLSKYLPKQMTEDEISQNAANFIAENKLESPREMGKVMGYFSKNYAGQYDGKVLSNIVKEMLA